MAVYFLQGFFRHKLPVLAESHQTFVHICKFIFFSLFVYIFSFPILFNFQDGLASVAYIDCSSKEISCSKIGYQSATIYLPPGNATLEQATEIHSLNYLEIAAQVLEQLPDAELLDKDSLEVTSSILIFETI